MRISNTLLIGSTVLLSFVIGNFVGAHRSRSVVESDPTEPLKTNELDSRSAESHDHNLSIDEAAESPTFIPTEPSPKSTSTQEIDKDLALKVAKILESNCGRCHRNDSEGGIGYIDDLGELIARKKIVPGQPENSRVWLRINDPLDPMPPTEDGSSVTEEDRDLIKRYIISLSKSFNGARLTQQETSVSEFAQTIVPIAKSHIISSIHAYLKRLQPEDRFYQRFLVLDHLYNAAKNQSQQSYLNLVRAATSKTLNCLTWAPTIVVPHVIDDQKTILAFDLRDLEWDRRPRTGRPNLWKLIAQDYPYALKYSNTDPANGDTSRRAREIVLWTRDEVAWLRADWFVANATQPHHYNQLLYDAVFEDVRKREPVETEFADNKVRLEQPMTQSDLFRRLGVDVIDDLRRGRAHRAGFTRSGVSAQPRMIERHSAIYGAMWNSYDFKRGSEFMNLNARPLGPPSAFPSNRFERIAFRHDGGEIIFGLPNGMHGYLLVDAVGKRIPFGPPDVVEDRAKTLGNGIIVNGLSCIACHKQGLVENFRDEIRFGIDGLDSTAKKIARRLFLDRSDLDPLINRDQIRYRQAAIEAMAPFASAQEVRQMVMGELLIEPVGTVAKRFLVDTLSTGDLAHELGVTELQLRDAIEKDHTLQELGLGAVAKGGTLSRELWEAGKGTSMYQRVAQAMRLGTPTGVIVQPWRGK